MKNVLAVSGIDLPLLKKDFETLLLPPDDLLSAPVQSHADMIFTFFDGKLFFHKAYFEHHRETVEYISDYCGAEICITNDRRCSIYPFDVSLNTLTVKDRLLCRKKSVSSILQSYPIINTNQGYAGCTSLFVNGTVITADPSIVASCQNNSIPVFKISGADILLPGYDTGFIGGACGVYKNTVYIYGNPLLSRSGRELYDFCNRNKLKLTSLCDGPVTDIGGIKFIEKKPEI